MGENPISKGIEHIPYVGLAYKAGRGVLRHPYLSTTAAGLGVFAVLAAGGVARGFAGIEVEVESEVAVENPGRGEIFAFDLDIEETPLVSSSSRVIGSEVGLDLTVSAHTDWFGGLDFNHTLESPSQEWNGIVKNVVQYNPDFIELGYDPGFPDTTEDDQIIMTIADPDEAFSTTSRVEPGFSWQNNEDMKGLIPNLTSAFVDSFTFLRNVPGISTVAEVNDDITQTLVSMNMLAAMYNVNETCTPLFFTNADVYRVVKMHIADDLGNSLIASAKDGTLDQRLAKMSLDEVAQVPIVVYIGNENAANPTNLKQSFKFTSEYEDKIKAMEADGNVHITDGEGTFECSISDEVRTEIAKESEDLIRQGTMPQQLKGKDA